MRITGSIFGFNPGRQRAGRSPASAAPGGFTLVEVLVAAALLAAALAITFGTFFSVSRAWRRGTAMADKLNHGEYVMEQIVNGLRCAFYPPPQSNAPAAWPEFGFWLEKNGDGPEARDVISWVKNGTALLGPDNALDRGLHRVQVTVQDDSDGTPAVVSRAWRPFANLTSFTAAEVEPFFISGKVKGLSCRVSTNRTEEGWEWEDEWKDAATNRLPVAVEVTLFLEADEKDEAPVEMKRLVEIPLAPLAWLKK